MAWNLDARVPVEVVPDLQALTTALAAGGPAALLSTGPTPSGLPAGLVARESYDPDAVHAVACTCCAGRPAAAAALDRLFLARVRGTVPWFSRVLALVGPAAGHAALDTALAGDAVTAARFRRA